jgi:xanthine dehydrogenase YagR molybdenum-binding subunit
MSIVGNPKAAAQGVAQAVMKTAIELAPDGWLPGGKPDPLIRNKHGLIGAPISRLDGPLKVQGKAKFAAEFPLDGMVYAAVAFSTVPRGRIVSFHIGEAEAAPGVVLVMTHENAPRMQNMPLFMTAEKAAGGDNLPIMQDDRIHWNGQPIAVVLAESQEQADHAKSLLRATYEEEPATTSFAGAKAQGTEPGMFMGQPLKVATGDAEAALSAAPVAIDISYTSPRRRAADAKLVERRERRPRDGIVPKPACRSAASTRETKSSAPYCSMIEACRSRLDCCAHVERDRSGWAGA